MAIATSVVVVLPMGPHNHGRCSTNANVKKDWVVPRATLSNRASSGSSSRSLDPLLSSLSVSEAVSDELLLATSLLRTRTFCDFQGSFGKQEYQNYLVKSTFEALKERLAGERSGFDKVSCLVAVVPQSDTQSTRNDFNSLFKADRKLLVVGSLDLNQTKILPGEIAGAWPKGAAAEKQRGYISNVCVATEFRRMGVGVALIKYAIQMALMWGITYLYVHVVAENEAARRLYEKCGFVKETEESASDARLLARPRRLLLRNDLKLCNNDEVSRHLAKCDDS